MANLDTMVARDDDEEYYSFTETETENEVGLQLVPLEEQVAAVMISSDDEPHSDSSTGDNTAEEESKGPTAMTARAYQLEMFEKSLKQNIIVTVGINFSAIPLPLGIVEFWLETHSDTLPRWILEAEKHKCMH
jgi:hypothetical protein